MASYHCAFLVKRKEASYHMHFRYKVRQATINTNTIGSAKNYTEACKRHSNWHYVRLISESHRKLNTEKARLFDTHIWQWWLCKHNLLFAGAERPERSMFIQSSRCRRQKGNVKSAADHDYLNNLTQRDNSVRNSNLVYQQTRITEYQSQWQNNGKCPVCLRIPFSPKWMRKWFSR